MKKTLALITLLMSVPLWASSTQPTLRYMPRDVRVGFTSQQDLLDKIWDTIAVDGDLAQFTMEEMGIFFINAKKNGQVMLYIPRPRIRSPKPRSPKQGLASPALTALADDCHVLAIEDLRRHKG